MSSFKSISIILGKLRRGEIFPAVVEFVFVYKAQKSYLMNKNHH